jgi:hypothetical protein
MQIQRIPKFSLLRLCIAFAGLGSIPALAQGNVLNAIFTPSSIKVDGNVETAWRARLLPPISPSAWLEDRSETPATMPAYRH